MFVSVSLFRLRSLAPESSRGEPDRPLPFGAHIGYQSIYTPDQLAAEHIYLSHYAPALSRLPGLRRHLVGRAFTPDGASSRYSHLAVITWADRGAWESAMQPGASERQGIPAVAEWVEAVESFGGDLAEVDPPGDEATTGALVVRLFTLKSGEQTAAANQYYTQVFAPQVRRRPGVRRYLQGPVLSLRSAPPRFARLSVIECRSWEAMQGSARPQLPPGVSPLEDWIETGETYATEFQEVTGL